MTEKEMLEAEKYLCENCCNWDKEKVQMDGYSNCKLTGLSVFGQESGWNCRCFNKQAENVVVPPCKLGDTVWYISRENPFVAFEPELKARKVKEPIDGILITKDDIYINTYNIDEVIDRCDKVGTDYAYLSKEDAERAIEEGDGRCVLAKTPTETKGTSPQAS